MPSFGYLEVGIFMGVIDERDEGQSFMDWFIHGSRKKKKKNKEEVVMEEVKDGSQVQGQPEQPGNQLVKSQASAQTVQPQVKPEQALQQVNPQVVQQPVSQPVAKEIKQEPKKEEKKSIFGSVWGSAEKADKEAEAKQQIVQEVKPMQQIEPVQKEEQAAQPVQNSQIQNVQQVQQPQAVQEIHGIKQPDIKDVNQKEVKSAAPQQPVSQNPDAQASSDGWTTKIVVKDGKKYVVKTREKYPKFVLLRQKLRPIEKGAEEATYSLISPYAYVEIKKKDGVLTYIVIEPVMDEKEKEAFEKLKVALIHFIDIPMKDLTERQLIEFLEEKVKWLLEETDIELARESFPKVMYYLYRDFIGLNELEPLLKDPYIEDIGVDGVGIPAYVVHQRFGSIRTNIIFDDENYLKELVVKLSQRANRYVSYAEPMLDGSLPDGSRVNATLARDVTSRGPTMSIRKFRDNPFSPIEMIGFKTADIDMLSYLWLVVENGMNILFCGGTGTGKTSFLNSISMFIPEHAKIVTIEDTREVRLDHENWLPAVARTGFGGTKTGEVTMFDLLREAFRQNPNYIIVGEVRGEEAAVMFQAMASGMTAMSTMHAGSADDALKRLQTRPISLPSSLMDSLDLLIVNTHAYEKGPSARRLKEMVEIENVDPNTNKVNVNRVFEWDPAADNYKHFDSKLLKEIAKLKGYSEDYIYRELENRKKVLTWLNEQKFDWKTVANYFKEYGRNKKRILDIVDGKEQPLSIEASDEKKDSESEKIEETKKENSVKADNKLQKPLEQEVQKEQQTGETQPIQASQSLQQPAVQSGLQYITKDQKSQDVVVSQSQGVNKTPTIEDEFDEFKRKLEQRETKDLTIQDLKKKNDILDKKMQQGKLKPLVAANEKKPVPASS